MASDESIDDERPFVNTTNLRAGSVIAVLTVVGWTGFYVRDYGLPADPWAVLFFGAFGLFAASLGFFFGLGGYWMVRLAAERFRAE